MTRFGVSGWEQMARLVHKAQSGGSGQIDAGSASRQSLGGTAHSEGQRGHQRASPFPGTASFDSRAKIQQQFDERYLESRLGRVATRHQHAHGGALGA